MTFKKLKEYLDSSDCKLVDSIYSENLDKPVLLTMIGDILADGSPYLGLVSTEKLLSLFRLSKEYFNICYGFYLDASMGGDKLDKLIEYSENVIYHVYAEKGYRVATSNEVKNGVNQLDKQVTKAFEQDKEEYLNLLLWTFTGYLRYYGKAGLTYTYTDGKPSDLPYDLIIRAGQKLRGMVDWLAVKGNYERAIATLKLSKKASKYKYPTFAEDEIKVAISAKQVMFICKTNIIGKGATENQAEAKKIVFKIENSEYKPTPYDIAIMRRAYDEIQSGEFEQPKQEIPEDIRVIIDRINLGVERGYLPKNDFSLKIIDSVKKYGRCSDKQLKILKDAEITVNKKLASDNKQEVNKDRAAEMENELSSIYDALGSGKLGGAK